ncbi:MAG TPA: hypothetical protein VK502_00390 [Candidatus Saccharimonadales bacterium]|nr:hypothetical protein [Candidatus Saccharimonadales bacterium]
MSVKNAWTELLKHRKDDFIGGEIEHTETPEGMYRGPIVSLSVEGNKLVVTTKWTAHVETNRIGLPVGDWHKEERKGATRFSYDLMDDITSPPQDMGEGRIYFQYPFSRIMLSPANGSKLDPAKVRGL